MTPRRQRRPLVAAALAALSLLSIAPVAFAHAELESITPADKSTVSPPTSIVAVFTENLDPSGSNLVLVDAAGKVVAQGGSVDPATTDQLVLDLSSTSLAEGTYTVRWTSKSAEDGDVDRGTTTFIATAGPSLPSSTGPAAASRSGEVGASAPTASSSGGTGTPASTATDALIPIVVVLVVLALLGLWLLRGRSRRIG